MSGEKPKLLVIAGPTASGKSALAIDWALATHAEIINADSQQVYRHFDIGTAKPGPEELGRVPHHLVSVVDPHEAFSAARFQALADAAIADIHARGKNVIVVGGTGLYLRILLHGLVAIPGADETFRDALRAEASEKSVSVLYARLKEVDAASAAGMVPTDLVRIIRALEIHHATGQPASALRRAHGFSESRYAYDWVVLNPEREVVYRAINERTWKMFHGGLLEEVEGLVKAGYRDTAPMGAVGYLQALAVVEGRMTKEEAISDTAQKTRHYAKRQWTWFRKEKGARFLSPPWTLSSLR